MAKHIISFDLRADFAFFRKPDINGKQGKPPIHRFLTYNQVHKPCLMGVFGAILGLRGYSKKGEFPEYYQVLKDLPVGIEPIKEFHEKGNFPKAKITFTNGTGFGSEEEGGVIAIEEQTLIKPAFRCYIMVDDEIKHQAILKERILKGESVYLPYLGKNEFSAWWDIETVKEYQYSTFSPNADFKIDSLFIREYPISQQKIKPKFSPSALKMQNMASFMYFERLPIGFDEKLFQYQLAEFAFTDWTLKQDSVFENLFTVQTSTENKIIQLF